MVIRFYFDAEGNFRQFDTSERLDREALAGIPMCPEGRGGMSASA